MRPNEHIEQPKVGNAGPAEPTDFRAAEGTAGPAQNGDNPATELESIARAAEQASRPIGRSPLNFRRLA
jgi:hypothetical protein